MNFPTTHLNRPSGDSVPMQALTCISGGPIIGVQTGGKVLVWDVPAENRRCSPFVAAMLADPECEQLIVGYPRIGYTRDYRKATVDQVCQALDRERKAYVVIEPPPVVAATEGPQ